MKRNLLFCSSLFVASLVLSGCKSTSDLNPQDDTVVSFGVGVEKRLTNRIAVSAEYSTVAGSSNEEFADHSGTDGQAIQINGERFLATPEAPLNLDYDFSFSTFIVEFDFAAIQNAFYTLKLSPGISYYDYDLDTDFINRSFTIEDSGFGYGAKLDNQFQLNEDLTFNLGFSIYNNSDAGNLNTAFAEFQYAYADNWLLIAGYRAQELEDEIDGNDNNDQCSPSAAAANCQNSEVSLGNNGVNLRLIYTF